MESNITLRQGLEKFRSQCKGRLSHDQEDTSSEAKVFFESHDIAHVLFDCDITLYGEGSVKIWTIFGTTLGFWNHLRGYQDANAFELSKGFPITHIARNLLKFLIAVPKIIIRTRRMSKPWNWAGFEPYLDKPISEIRIEFNIRIVN